MNNFQSKLSERLQQTLPGLKAQLKLAPESHSMNKPVYTTVNAGVLILIFPGNKSELSTVFIKRAEYEGLHSAQISFPGGKYEDQDVTLKETAIRESKEEIGIDPNKISILGQLTSLFIPVSNFLVHPFVAYSETKPKFELDKNEVEYIIECSIESLINLPIKYTKRIYDTVSFNIPYFDIENEMVWGATSMILNEFIEILSDLSYYNKGTNLLH